MTCSNFENKLGKAIAQQVQANLVTRTRMHWPNRERLIRRLTIFI